MDRAGEFGAPLGVFKRPSAEDPRKHLFFPDSEAFRALETLVFPRLVERRAVNQTIRIWVPGCSTGEEVYSIAIGLCDLLGSDAARVPIQIIGT